jgi:hypothetical protein
MDLFYRPTINLECVTKDDRDSDNDSCLSAKRWWSMLVKSTGILRVSDVEQGFLINSIEEEKGVFHEMNSMIVLDFSRSFPRLK